MLILRLFMFITLFFSYSFAHADFYRYRDVSGGMNVTNDISSIPERYRADVQVVRDVDLERTADERARRIKSEKSKEQRRLERPHTISAGPSAEPPSPQPPIPLSQETKQSSDPQKNDWLDRQLPLLKVIGVFVLLFLAWLAAAKVVSLFVPHTFAVVIKIALFVAIAIYAFKGYSERIVDAFALIKNETNTVQKAVDKSAERICTQAE